MFITGNLRLEVHVKCSLLESAKLDISATQKSYQLESLVALGQFFMSVIAEQNTDRLLRSRWMDHSSATIAKYGCGIVKLSFCSFEPGFSILSDHCVLSGLDVAVQNHAFFLKDLFFCVSMNSTSKKPAM